MSALDAESGQGAGVRALARILIYVLLAMIILMLGRIAYVSGYSVFHEQAMEAAPGRDVVVTIPEGAGISEISRILRDDGLIASTWIFLIQERLSAYHGRLQPGVFTLNTSMTPTEILARLAGES